MKKIRIIETAACFLLAGVFCALSVFYAFPALKEKTSASSSPRGDSPPLEHRYLRGRKRLPHLFFKPRFRRLREIASGVYVMVSSYTAEGAAAAFAEGNYPDMISFGAGFSEAAEKVPEN